MPSSARVSSSVSVRQHAPSFPLPIICSIYSICWCRYEPGAVRPPPGFERLLQKPQSAGGGPDMGAGRAMGAFHRQFSVSAAPDSGGRPGEAPEGVSSQDDVVKPWEKLKAVRDVVRAAEAPDWDAVRVAAEDRTADMGLLSGLMDDPGGRKRVRDQTRRSALGTPSGAGGYGRKGRAAKAVGGGGRGGEVPQRSQLARQWKEDGGGQGGEAGDAVPDVEELLRRPVVKEKKEEERLFGVRLAGGEEEPEPAVLPGAAVWAEGGARVGRGRGKGVEGQDGRDKVVGVPETIWSKFSQGAGQAVEERAAGGQAEKEEDPYADGFNVP